MKKTLMICPQFENCGEDCPHIHPHQKDRKCIDGTCKKIPLPCIVYDIRLMRKRKLQKIIRNEE